jgi:hypothetical protein
VNSEQLQQLYGGEITDHIKIQNQLAPDLFKVVDSGEQLTNIYNNQVKSKGSVNVTNSLIAFNPKHLIDKPSDDPISLSFKDTLNKVAAEIGLTDADGVRYSPEYNPLLKDQSKTDIDQANDAVLKALEELKSLGEI